MDAAATDDFESVVGITAFTTQTAGFNGIIKQRFSDFIVREISLTNEVAYLHSLDATEIDNKYFGKAKDEDNDTNNATFTTTESTEDIHLALANKIFQELLSIPNANFGATYDEAAFLQFIVQALQAADDCPSEFIGFSTTEKSARGALHGIIRKHAAKHVETEMCNVDGQPRIRFVAKHKMKATNTKVVKRRAQWPSDLPNYLQFTMLKENVDTMSAVNILGKALRTTSTSFDYNGTKDKRGITAQRCTIYRRKPSEFQRVNSYSHTPTIRVGDFCYVSEAARLGALSGNRFEIILRSVDLDDAALTQACKALQHDGFINYFGLQRFGKGGSSSHELGLQQLKSNWRACVDMLFTRRNGERAEIRHAKDMYWSGNLSAALDSLPQQMQNEREVLRRLVANPTDHQSAYHAIRRNARLICAHAYQSYLWNHVASRRVQQHGLTCVVGDLVLLDAAAESGAVDDEVLLADNQEQEDNNNNTTNNTVKILTTDDIASGQYSIVDVVLPLPGRDVVFPAHDCGALYLELMQRDGVSVDDYATCNPSYRLKGTYRRLVQRARDVQWRIVRYSRFDEELAECELNTFRTTRHNQSVGKDNNYYGNNEDRDNNPQDCRDHQTDFPFKALELKFSLPQGTYATMLLRELTKQSTESQFQATLTAADAAGDAKNDAVSDSNSKMNRDGIDSSSGGASALKRKFEGVQTTEAADVADVK